MYLIFQTIVSEKMMEDVKIEQRSVIRFLTLEGVAPKRILKRLQKVYREEALSSLEQVEYWATETNDDRRRRRTTTMQLRSTNVIFLFIYFRWSNTLVYKEILV